MKTILFRVLQFVFGLVLVVGGLNHFFGFFPIPDKEGFAQEFLDTLHQSGYVFPVVGLIMVSSGILLLLNRWTIFALLTQLPISFNIFAFHVFHDFHGLLIGWMLMELNMMLLVRRSRRLSLIFQESGGLHEITNG